MEFYRHRMEKHERIHKFMKLSTRIYENEGYGNLRQTVRDVARAATAYDIKRIVVFTAVGDGALMLRHKLDESFAIIAVSFPPDTIGVSRTAELGVHDPAVTVRSKIEHLGIPVVQGSMPFMGLDPRFSASGPSAVKVVFGVFGGGMQLCVQAVLMASDAGLIRQGDRCISMSADTALVCRGGHSHNFLSTKTTFAVEHIICKPLFYQISRPELNVGVFEEAQVPQSMETTDVSPDTSDTTSEHEKGEGKG